MFDPNFNGFSVFADVDQEGNIKDALIGERILPDRQYDFFFYVEKEIADSLQDYKVEVNGMKATLVKK